MRKYKMYVVEIVMDKNNNKCGSFIQCQNFREFIDLGKKNLVNVYYKITTFSFLDIIPQNFE